jgi:hypothetical protein
MITVTATSNRPVVIDPTPTSERPNNADYHEYEIITVLGRDAFSGVALQGPLAGQILTPLKSTIVFWFGWKDFFPDTLVYGLE